jgi:predicted Zn-dependent peptidase
MLVRQQTRSGVTVLVEPIPHSASAALGVFVPVGALHEPAELAGAAHLIEHMVFKGTPSFPTARLLSQAVEGVGGWLNASTGFENTVYSAKVAVPHFGRALQVLAEMTQQPLFDTAELRKERRVILEELRGIQDSPSDLVHELMQHAMWGEHPLGRDIAGNAATVAGMPKAAVERFFRLHYQPQQLVVSVAGGVDAATVVAAVEQAFAQPARRRRIAVPPPAAAQPGPQLVLETRELEQVSLALGLPGLAAQDADRRAWQALDMLVGGGMSSRLFQLLREEHGLAYAVGSYTAEYADCGSWSIYAGLEPKAVRPALRLIAGVLADLARNGPQPDELQLVKEQLKGGLLLSLEDSWAVASRNANAWLRSGTILPVERVLAEFDALTPADLQRVARRLLQPQSRWLALVGPLSAAEQRGLREELEESRWMMS